jgi:hypothetical protein
MKLVDQWRSIESELPPDWVEVRLELTVETPSERRRAAALLGPANPGRVGEADIFSVRRGGSGVGAEGIRRLLDGVDRARIWSTLRLVDVTTAARVEAVAEPAPAPALSGAWEDALATLPPDWSDLECELTLRSSDYLARASLLMAPLNPTRTGPGNVLWFRCARRSGYGASPGMVRRCLERCEVESIRGDLTILWMLSDTKPVATQGPVWRVGGRAV